MVAMILANESAREESENHFRPRQTDQADELLQRLAMIPVGERLQHILSSRVFSAEKPDIGDAHRRQGVPSLNLAYRAECRRLLRTGFVRTAAAPRAKHDGDAPVFVQSPRHI